jgi:hypothetical protein
VIDEENNENIENEEIEKEDDLDIVKIDLE